MPDVLGGPGPANARRAEIARLQILVAANPFAINSASNAGIITTYGHSVAYDTDLVLLFYMIRGGGSVLTSQWNPPNADPTTNNTFLRARAVAGSPANSRIECWYKRVPQTQWGLTCDIESTYSGTVNNEVAVAVGLSGVEPANLFAEQTDGATDSAGSLSLNIYGINNSVILSACCIRTSTSQTITKDASQTEHVNLLTSANGLRGVFSSEQTAGNLDVQSFTFGDSTRPGVIMSIVLNPVMGKQRPFDPLYRPGLFAPAPGEFRR